MRSGPVGSGEDEQNEEFEEEDGNDRATDAGWSPSLVEPNSVRGSVNISTGSNRVVPKAGAVTPALTGRGTVPPKNAGGGDIDVSSMRSSVMPLVQLTRDSMLTPPSVKTASETVVATFDARKIRLNREAIKHGVKTVGDLFNFCGITYSWMDSDGAPCAFTKNTGFEETTEVEYFFDFFVPIEADPLGGRVIICEETKMSVLLAIKLFAKLKHL